MGRKIDLDSTRRKRLLEALEAGATLRLAAAACGVSEDTLARWRSRDPVLVADIETAEAAGAVAALDVIKAAAKSGTWQAAAWLLERRYPREYGRRQDDPPAAITPVADPRAEERLTRMVANISARLEAEAEEQAAIAAELAGYKKREADANLVSHPRTAWLG